MKIQPAYDRKLIFALAAIGLANPILSLLGVRSEQIFNAMNVLVPMLWIAGVVWRRNPTPVRTLLLTGLLSAFISAPFVKLVIEDLLGSVSSEYLRPGAFAVFVWLLAGVIYMYTGVVQGLVTGFVALGIDRFIREKPVTTGTSPDKHRTTAWMLLAISVVWTGLLIAGIFMSGAIYLFSGGMKCGLMGMGSVWLPFIAVGTVGGSLILVLTRYRIAGYVLFASGFVLPLLLPTAKWAQEVCGILG